MTLSSKQRCAWCGEVFVLTGGPGRRSRYCRRSHRQRAYESRRLAELRQLAPGEVLIAAQTLADLKDGLYILEAAMEDVDADLADATDQASETDQERHRQALWHLYSAAAGLRALRIEPQAVGAP